MKERTPDLTVRRRGRRRTPLASDINISFCCSYSCSSFILMD